jgi:hypothetical protein
MLESGGVHALYRANAPHLARGRLPGETEPLEAIGEAADRPSAPQELEGSEGV